MRAYDEKKEELFEIRGDAKHGMTSSMDLTKNASGHPLVRYRDMVLEVDVYSLPGTPLYLHLFCPKCRNMLTISEERKQIAYDPKLGDSRYAHPEGPNRVGGRLDVEAFQCTWEAGEDRRMDFGLGLCGWKVGIDNNIAKDA